MNGMKAVRNGFACFLMFIFCSQIMARPLTIIPATNITFPVTMNTGQPVVAVYTVTNNSTYPLTGLHLQNLPSNVSQVTTNGLCGSSFDLARGAQCTLELSINTDVTNPRHANNTTICIPGNPKVCQGFAINIPASGWTLMGGANVQSVDIFVESLTSNASTLYALGHSVAGFSALATYVNGVWAKIFQGDGTTTGHGSVFQTLSFVNTTTGYLGGHNNVYGTVYSLDTSTNPATVVDLNFKDATQTPGGQTEYPSEVDSLLYHPANSTLYIGGEVNTDHIHNYGAVYSYTAGHPGTFTNLSLENAAFVDSLAITGGNLYAAVVGTGVNFAEVFSYPLTGGSWSDTYLPNSIDEVHSLVVDSQGDLYAGGFDNEGGTVWKYSKGVWRSLNFTGGSEVKLLTIDNNDVLYAVGVNNTFGGGVWSYSNGYWTAINPGSSSFVNTIAWFSGNIYIAGQSLISEQCVWQK